MNIALVTEFDQEKYFQWRYAWTDEMQIKLKCVVKTIHINPSVLAVYTKEDPYWDWLKKADLVYVYCSRIGAINKPEEMNFVDKYGRVYNWYWWQLPRYAKLMMKPDAKMIVQWDDEFIWLFHPNWVWWSSDPDDRGGPEQFFSYGIMDVPDMVWTNLENPEYRPWVKTPLRYMPLPHIVFRTPTESHKMTKEPYDMHEKKSTVILRHTSRVASVEHLIPVAEEIGLPLIYYSTSWNSPFLSREIAVSLLNLRIPVNHVLYLETKEYMEQLAREGFLAIDDAEKYIGWSRFAMECALTHVPCIGSTLCVKLVFPDLYTAPKDHAKQVELAKRLINDRDFYNRVANEGFKRCIEHLDTERLCKEMVQCAHDLNAPDTPFDEQSVLTKENFPKLMWWN